MTTEQQAIADLIYLELKEAPLTIGELSQRLNIELGKVSHTINHMIDKYPICQKDEKYYVPKESIKAWIGAFITLYLIIDRVDRMNRKEIIQRIGRLEDKLELHPELEDEINRQIRELGKKLEGNVPQGKQRGEPFISKEKLIELSKSMFNYEIANMYGVSKQTVSKHIKEWGIEAYGTRKKKKVV